MTSKVTNIILAVIAVLLAVIAAELYLYRPVTRLELQRLHESGNDEARDARINSIPLVNVRDVIGTVDVDVIGTVDIDGDVTVREVQGVVAVEPQ